ncbi:MAG: 30S ribosomal protein S16 [bacterium]|nr:30S ribosomal protein S16 [bacterium]
MATRIRLQRHGKKGKPFYHIVSADSRAKRDGRFIEKLGTYNPNTNPATIDLDFDRALHWVGTGAEMSDTARAILSYKGVLYKNHLIKGVAKGALTEAQVEERFAKWLEEKEAKVTAKSDKATKDAEKEKADRLKAEAEKSAARAKEIEAKNTPEVEETEEAPAEEAEAPAAEGDAPAEEAPAAEETPAEEPAAEEAKEEAPATEAKAEEAPAAEEKKEDASEETEAEEEAK